MAKGKRHHNWKEKVKEWESSNQSPKAWCKENSIPYTTLRGWRDRLKKSNHEHIPSQLNSGFVELKTKAKIQLDPGIILEYCGVKIHLQREFNKAVLKECLHFLRGALC